MDCTVIMKFKSHSLILGYREFTGKLSRQSGENILILEGKGAILPIDYKKNGFMVLEASRAELESLVEAEYESRTTLLKFLDQ